MGRNRLIVVTWAALSCGAVLLVLNWPGLADDPSSWASLCTSAGGALATLLVLVVTFAFLWLQLHNRFTARLAMATLDVGAAAYGFLFAGSVVFPFLAAAAPSRALTLVTLAALAPVVFSVVPAVALCASRLETRWLLNAPVASALRRLHASQPSVDRNSRAAAAACQAAMQRVHLILGQADGNPDDCAQAYRAARDVLVAAARLDDLTLQSHVRRHADQLVARAQQSEAPADDDLITVLVSVARSVPHQGGRDTLASVIGNLRSIGDGLPETNRTRLRLIEAARTLTVDIVRATSRSGPPLSLAEWRPSPTTAPKADDPTAFAITRFHPERGKVSPYTVFHSGCDLIRGLLGPTLGARDDSFRALAAAKDFGDGCLHLAGMVTDLMDEGVRPPEPTFVVDTLEDLLCRQLRPVGESFIPGRFGPRRAAASPYALELEALHKSLHQIAASAYRNGYDDIALASLQALVSAATHAIRQDDTIAREAACNALRESRSSLLDGKDHGSHRTIADSARRVDLLEALQPANLELLTALLEDELHPGSGDAAFRATERRAVVEWALREPHGVIGGHGQPSLAIARTAEKVRRTKPFASEYPHLAPHSTMLQNWAFMRRPTGEGGLVCALIHTAADPEATIASEVTDDVRFFTAAVRWRQALELAESESVPEELLAAADISSLALGYRFLRTMPPAADSPSSPAAPTSVAGFYERLADWAAAPWCRTPMHVLSAIPAGSAEPYPFQLVAAPDSAPDLRSHLLHLRRQRRDLVTALDLGSLDTEDVWRTTGLLWGSWPPPERLAFDPFSGPSDDVASLVRSRWSDSAHGHRYPALMTRQDRTYFLTNGAPEAVIVEEPDGSTRLLAGITAGSSQFTWGYRGTGPHTLALALTHDALGAWARCQTCAGGSCEDACAPGHCQPCRGSGWHPDLGSGMLRVLDVIAAIPQGANRSVSRSQLLDAIVA